MAKERASWATPNASDRGKARWKAIVDRAPVGVHCIDTRGRISSVNASCGEILGLQHEADAIGMVYLDLIDPEDREAVQEAMNAVYAGETTAFEVTTGDGRVLASNLAPLPGSSDIFGVIRDISQQRRADAAKGATEARYRTLVEASPYCIHEIDLEGRLSSMNPAGLCMMGVACETHVVGTPYLDSVSDRDRPRIDALLRAALDGEMSEFTFEASNGLVFASSFVPIEDDEGQVVRLMGLTQDVTSQTRDREALVENQQRLGLALHATSSQGWECEWSTHRVTMTVGNEVGELTHRHFSKEDVLGQVHEDDRAALVAAVSAHQAGEVPDLQIEIRTTLFASAHRWSKLRGRVVERGADGAPIRLAGTIRDVHEQHVAEAARKRLESQLQQAQRMESVGELAGGIAHDFNNLLQVMMGHIGLVQETTARDTEEAELLDEAQLAGERAAQLTRQLLTFSRQEQAHRRVLDPRELLAAFSTMVTRVLPETIVFSMTSTGDVPPILIDERQLEQVVLNLCVNARDAMPKGGKLSIDLKGEDDDALGPCAQIVVADSGTGMDARTASRAFDPFFTTKEKHAGTGLGLAMVYGIVTQNDGSVHLESDVGEGTSVVLRFPAANGTREAPDRKVFRSLPSSPRRGCILVVEDEAGVRRLYERTLETAGHDVIVAEDGEQGLARYMENRERVDVLLVDAVMPKMTGEDMCRRILEEDSGARILFTSGYHEEDALSQDFLCRHGLVVLSKPHTPDELVTAVNALLEADGA